jgi:hypothetical protein
VLEAGADYTLLVRGTAAAPLPSLIEDDNQLPADASMARVRLVNGVSGLAAPLSLTIDLMPVGSGVAAGEASSHALVSATTTADIAASSAGVATPLYRELDRTLLAGSTYSVFVLGTPGAATGQLRKDR